MASLSVEERFCRKYLSSMLDQSSLGQSLPSYKARSGTLGLVYILVKLKGFGQYFSSRWIIYRDIQISIPRIIEHSKGKDG
jgi:hypothetical protein